jgi:hypothetical protein
MKTTLRRFQQLLLTLAVMGLLVPCPSSLLASQLNTAAPKHRPMLIDVALDENGTLRGQFLDTNGQPVANSAVHFHDGKERHGQTTTDARGNFAFEGLEGGVYAVLNEQAAQIVRVWAPNTAPPSASGGVLLVEGSAERGNGFGLCSAFGIGGLLVLSGIIAIIAVAATDRGNGS